MLGVVELLKLRGLDTSARIKFVRHQDQRLDLYDLMISGHLDRYQRVQSRPVFRNCDFIISFLGLPRSQARFLGVYRVKQEKHVKDIPPPPDYSIPENPDWFYYDLEKAVGFEDLQQRIVINWGQSARMWHQWVKNERDKEVVELLPPGYTRPWPDYLDFILNHDELMRICNNPAANREWVHKLSAVAGIYLITYKERQYVGSAYGKEGIYGRWQQYARGGLSQNVKLRELLKIDPSCYQQFHYSILRTLPGSIPQKEVIAKEILYQQKLGSRDAGWGLN